MTERLVPTDGFPTATEVNVGDQLPELALPLTRTFIVSAALATRDFQDVHHDHVLARQRGTPDIFMNILTSQGLVGRYITDWAGPSARLRKIATRLGVPNYPGDTMVFSGDVVTVDGALVTLTVTGRNSIGVHVTATVEVELPAVAGNGTGVDASSG